MASMTPGDSAKDDMPEHIRNVTKEFLIYRHEGQLYGSGFPNPYVDRRGSGWVAHGDDKTIAEGTKAVRWKYKLKFGDGMEQSDIDDVSRKIGLLD